MYRVLYAGSEAYACYLETLARLRPDMTFYAELDQIDGDIDHIPPGVIEADWFSKRRIGTATVGGSHAIVGHSVWMQAFRKQLAAEILAAGFTDFDAHALHSTAPRLLTQQISRMVYDNHLDGIRYLSKHGEDAVCWALFERRVVISDDEEQRISPTDPDLGRAMTTYGLKFAWELVNRT